MDFNDLKGDAMDGAETMHLLGATNDDLQDSGRFSKVQDIVSYYKGRPEKRTEMYRLLIGKPMVDKINHVHEYVSIKKEYENTMSQFKEVEERYKKLETSRGYLEKQLSYFER